jgi:hypothetical protein
VKRIGRSFFGGAAALSLVLCIATLTLYPCTHDRYRVVRFSQTIGTEANPTSETIDVGLSPSSLDVIWMAIDHFPYTVELNAGWVMESQSPEKVDYRSVRHNHWGFGFFDRTSIWNRNPVYTRRTTAAGFSFWFLALVFAIVPTLWITARLRKRRQHRREMFGRFCSQCGYDLRSTPDRCPECGKAIERVVGGGPA